MLIKKIEIYLQKKIVIFLMKSCSAWDSNLRKVFLPSNATYHSAIVTVVFI